MFIYVIRNSATGKVYIGQHKGNNLKKYLQTKLSQAPRRAGGSHLFASMRKHPHEVWSIEPLISDVSTKEELDRLERLLIALYDTRNPEIGYNICRGGEGFTGTHSELTRAKIAEASRVMWERSDIRESFTEKMAGRPMHPNARAALEPYRGHKPSEAARKRLAVSHMGLRRSPESKVKQAASVTGTKNHFYGKQHSAATRTKMSDKTRLAYAEGRASSPFIKGHKPYLSKHSEATCARMSELARKACAEGRKKVPEAIRKPVRCIDTGEIFPSVKEAINAFGGSSGHLSRSIKKGHKHMGKLFEYVQSTAVQASF